MTSSTSSYRSRIISKYSEVCVGGISHQVEPHTLLAHFEQFGVINHYNFTSPNGGGYVFITYEDAKSVDRCIAHRPHRIGGRHTYVKRALPFDAEHPREHIDSARDIMLLTDSPHTDEQFLLDLREYFSSYGILYACKYCHEANFDYILVEFADVVDRIILDKPHFLKHEELYVMKCIPSNKDSLNNKYSSKNNSHTTNKDAIDIENNNDDDNEKFIKYELNYKKDNSKDTSHEQISEIDLENEVHHLQNQLKQITEDFTGRCKQLEEDYCEQLRKLNENSEQTYRLQQDLEQEYTKLLNEHQLLKNENEQLNEEYLMAELENFEITSYYEQILNETKSKSLQYETEYTQKLQNLSINDSSPVLPAIPDDDEE